VKVLILAAGYGTRLKQLGENTPKALLPINNKPLINFILKTFEKLPGLNEVFVVTNDKFAGHFETWAKEQKGLPYKITVVNDGTKTPETRLGSIGDIDYVLKQKKVQDDLLVVGGDNLFDFNIEEYIRFASKKNDCVSLGLYDIKDLSEAKLFGVVALDGNGKVTSFEEKPPEPKSTLIAMCFYYLPKKTLGLVADYLKDVGKSDTAGDYIRWLHKKTHVYGFQFTGRWYDIGSIEAYHEAQKAFV
jgi:glucose-1-phosphate thymidylyltransferase